MSLVGTRPPTVDEWDKYELHHRARLATKPGLVILFVFVNSKNDLLYGKNDSEFSSKASCVRSTSGVHAF